MNLARGVGRLSDMVMVEGKGSWMWTKDKRKLLDFTCGIAVTNLGHCHPKVTEAVREQAGKLVHGQVNIGYHEPMLQLIDRLHPILPEGLDSVFFATTGAEAVENSIKLARQATGKQNIIAMQGGYHGRTFGTMALTSSKTVFHAGFGPLMSGITIVPFPYMSHGPFDSDEQCAEHAAFQLELALKQQTAPEETAAVLLEPILGEGGYVVPPKSYMTRVREICTENDILLIADEIQCGFGRSGEYFASNGLFNITPDILVMAKGIANGFPISGIASRRELTDKQLPGTMGGTYAGNAVSCAAAIATIDAMAEENILENVRERSTQVFDRLGELADSGRFPIMDVRGAGLMIGVEFFPEVAQGTAAAVSQACLNRGLILLTTSCFETLRFMPPLNVSASEVDLAMEIFEAALADVFDKSSSVHTML